MKSMSATTRVKGRPERTAARWHSRLLVGAAGTFALLLAAGCGAGNFDAKSFSASLTKSITLQGRARGGQQPVAGAQVRLFSVGNTGYGSRAASQLANTYTNATGGFSLTNDYSCSSGTLVFLVVTGGNPGLSANNPNLAELVALGPCVNLTNTTFLQVNELTTVASVFALASFMSGPTNIGAPPTNASGLAVAFADVNELVNTTTGTVGGPALPSSATLPLAKINSLANIIASCVNSAGGTAGDGSTCGTLFAATTPAGGAAPTDTVTALVNIAQNPGMNVGTLFGLTSASPPYSPQLPHAPNDWLLAATYNPSSLSGPAALAVDAGGNVWIANKTGNSVAELSHTGANLPGSTYPGALNAPSALALDASGNPWVALSGSNSLVYLTPTSGSVVASGTGGLSTPSGVAIDAQGNVWVSNGGANGVTELNSSGGPVGANGFSASGLKNPLGVAISPK